MYDRVLPTAFPIRELRDANTYDGEELRLIQQGKESRARGSTPGREPDPFSGLRSRSSPFLLVAACVLTQASLGHAAPIVDAGPARVLAFPAKDLTLFGHATDPRNNPLTVQWTQVSGPSSAIFSAPWALATTVSFTATGAYVFRLSVSDGTSIVTQDASVTVNPASSQTAFYVDPSYAGSTEDGSASTPWKSLLETDSDYTSKWNTIKAALAINDVIIYFSARQAGSDTPEQLVPPNGGTLFVNRPCRGGTTNCPGAGDTSTHRLTLDGMSMYNTNDAAPNWVTYTGTNKFKINCSNTCGSMSIGWGDDNQRDYVTIRGFEATGPSARVRWGGNYSVLEHMWVHDVTQLGAEVQFNAAVSDWKADGTGCQDFGKDHDITIRNNLIERGVDEGLYIAGTYSYTRYGGCPSYGNTHYDILIEGNTINDPGANGGEGDGIDLKTGLHEVTLRNNVFNNPHDAAEGGAVNSSGTFPPARTNYLFEGNRINNGTNDTTHYSGGFTLTQQNGTVIRNNVVYNTPGGAAINLADDANFPSREVAIYNNTVYGNAAGIVLTQTHGATLRNNLVFGNGTGRQIDGSSSDGIDSDYNLLAPTGSGFTEGSHSIVQSSTSGLVMDAAGGDFRLISGSPAIDQGLALSSPSNLAVGVTSFNTDIARVARPQGAWAIGAYEYLPAGGGTPDGGTPPGSAAAPRGCGCQNAGSSELVFSVALLWILVRLDRFLGRRRSRRD